LSVITCVGDVSCATVTHVGHWTTSIRSVSTTEMMTHNAWINLEDNMLWLLITQLWKSWCFQKEQN